MAKKRTTLPLEEIVNSPNLATSLDDELLTTIGMRVVEELEKDWLSRQEWENAANKAIKLAKLSQSRKNDPWPNASNVKFPMITDAIIQFSARTLPEIIRNDKVVEIAVVGEDPEGLKEQRAKRVAQHMSYQLLVESDEWTESVDKLIHLLATVGTAHKKVYFDPIMGKNRSELVHHNELIINQNIKSLATARRISHILEYVDNDILERMRTGLFTEYDMDELQGPENTDSDDRVHEIIEQHRYLDLDGDGYEEPYIVTVHRESLKVLRIVARFDPEDISYNESGQVSQIKAINYFIDFHLIPSVDGSYWSVGFGTLLYGLNEAANTTINQLIDAGTLANMQGGFVGKGLRMSREAWRLKPGEWKTVTTAPGQDIKSNIVPVDYKEPSTVLFQLLGLLIEVGKETASLTDAITGNQPGQNVPATTILSLVENGLKLFNSIQKRIHVALKKEFKELYRLNRIFLDPTVYFKTMDSVEAVHQEDYEDGSLDIKPVSDPNLSSDAQRLARDQALMQLIELPDVSRREILYRYLSDLNVPQIEKVLPEPDPNAPPPPEVVEMQADITAKAAKTETDLRAVAVKEMEAEIKAAKVSVEIEKMRAEAIKALAEAESKEPGQQLEIMKTFIDTLAKKEELAIKRKQAEKKPNASQ